MVELLFLGVLLFSWRLLIPLVISSLSRKMGLIGYSIYCIVRSCGRLG
jgi:hypothetical protein